LKDVERISSFNMWKVSPYSHGFLNSQANPVDFGRSSQEEHTEASASCRYDFRAPLKSAGCPRIKASDFKNHENQPPNLTRRPSFHTSSFPFPQIWMKHDEGYLNGYLYSYNSMEAPASKRWMMRTKLSPMTSDILGNLESGKRFRGEEVELKRN
jgi:hypothetical protein